MHTGWTSLGSGSLVISYQESLGNQLRLDAYISDSVHEITASLLFFSEIVSHTTAFLGFIFLARIIFQKKNMLWFTSCELIFNSALMAWWKTCFPFHLVLVPQSTGSSPLCRVSGNYRQAGQDELMQDWNHKQYPVYEVRPHATPMQSLPWDLYHRRRLPWLKSTTGSQIYEPVFALS